MRPRTLVAVIWLVMALVAWLSFNGFAWGASIYDSPYRDNSLGDLYRQQQEDNWFRQQEQQRERQWDWQRQNDPYNPYRDNRSPYDYDRPSCIVCPRGR